MKDDDIQEVINIKAVEMDVELVQIKSLADGTFNILLNAPEYSLNQVRVVMGWLKQMARIVITNG